MIELHLANGKGVAVVDDVDGDLADLSWHRVAKDYAGSYIDGKKVTLHRVVLARKLGGEIPVGYEVDHADGDPLNNRRSNLRAATHQQNTANARHPVKGYSRYRGVTYDARPEPLAKRWGAYIVVHGKQLWLGRYADEAEAARAYDTAALDAFGAFARLNFPEADGRAA